MELGELLEVAVTIALLILEFDILKHGFSPHFVVEIEIGEIWNRRLAALALALHLPEELLKTPRQDFHLTVEKKMFMLSTGSKRKVWLAAALASHQPLTLLDEPTGGLDAGSMRCLWRTLAEVAQEGDRAVIVASGERVDDVPLAGTITLPLVG